jgi:segregation and condensation protein B
MTTEATEQRRLLEAILFASAEPVSERALASRLPRGADVKVLLTELQRDYAGRGVALVQAGGSWAFNTAPDLAPMLHADGRATRKLSRAAVETLAIIAYHQPITRAEIEDLRGVQVGRGTIDVLFEQGWLRTCGRRQTPGRPVTWGTTDAFLRDFGLASLRDLPGVDELRAAGLLETAATASPGAPPADRLAAAGQIVGDAQ